jgi:hypothetical protein
MERNLAYLLPENLSKVFNETDLDKRKGVIADLWDEDGVFIDPDGVHQGPALPHEGTHLEGRRVLHQRPTARATTSARLRRGC